MLLHFGQWASSLTWCPPPSKDSWPRPSPKCPPHKLICTCVGEKEESHFGSSIIMMHVWIIMLSLKMTYPRMSANSGSVILYSWTVEYWWDIQSWTVLYGGKNTNPNATENSTYGIMWPCPVNLTLLYKLDFLVWGLGIGPVWRGYKEYSGWSCHTHLRLEKVEHVVILLVD